MPKYRYGEVEDKDQIGIVTGLAWTDVGGELLTIEAAMMPGKGRMTVTGNLRDVMKESISAAASYVRMRAVAFGIEPPLFDKRDIHVHVPEGATPKDGPSAGVAMATAIVSVMTGIPVRRDVAMTGEITLRGRVWPIAGLKEKLLAAHRAGMKEVVLPARNERDLDDVPKDVLAELKIEAPADMLRAQLEGAASARARMQAARARVTRLRNQVADLEKAASRDAQQGADPKRRLDELARARAELVEAERAVGEIEEEARAALRLQPDWSYVKDILLPQIEKARG